MLVYVCDLVTCEVQYAIIKIDTVAVDTLTIYELYIICDKSSYCIVSGLFLKKNISYKHQ